MAKFLFKKLITYFEGPHNFKDINFNVLSWYDGGKKDSN